MDHKSFDPQNSLCLKFLKHIQLLSFLNEFTENISHRKPVRTKALYHHVSEVGSNNVWSPGQFNTPDCDGKILSFESAGWKNQKPFCSRPDAAINGRFREQFGSRSWLTQIQNRNKA